MTDTTMNQPAVAVIGYGTAGVNALIGLRNGGYRGPIRVFSNTNIGPYSPILTSYYAGGQKTYDQCFPWSEAELADLNAEVLSNSPVTTLDVENHQVITEAGSYPYSKCVIATGSRPMCYGFPQTDAYQPMVLRTMDDAERFKRVLEDPACQRVLISGASMVALKSLEAALNKGKACTLVGMNPHVLDFNAFPQAAERFEAGLRQKGVQLRLGMTVASVDASDDPAKGKLKVGFSNGDVDYFDDIMVSHGMKSNLEFLPEGALQMDRAILVDQFMRTSNPDVYAAGDVVQALELISGQQRIVGIWKTAAVQGQVAGSAIAAELAGNQPSLKHAYKGAIATNTIAVNGTLFISAGTMEITDDRYLEVRETADMTVIYLFEQRKSDRDQLVGFNIVADEDNPGGPAYDIGAMLTMRIERGFKK